jgi:hypothetical protein
MMELAAAGVTAMPPSAAAPATAVGTQDGGEAFAVDFAESNEPAPPSPPPRPAMDIFKAIFSGSSSSSSEDDSSDSDRCPRPLSDGDSFRQYRKGSAQPGRDDQVDQHSQQ